MRFRKLRIAWSVAWGLLAVLLIVLWVRSYWAIYALFGTGSPPSPNQYFAVGCERGVVAVSGSPSLSSLLRAADWKLETFSPGLSPPPPQGFLGFYYETSQQQGTRLRFPIWFLVILSVIAAAIPWIRPFSLRTLLIVTTLLGVILGLVVYAAS
jgi:hypothetical protein